MGPTTPGSWPSILSCLDNERVFLFLFEFTSSSTSVNGPGIESLKTQWELCEHQCRKKIFRAVVNYLSRARVNGNKISNKNNYMLFDRFRDREQTLHLCNTTFFAFGFSIQVIRGNVRIISAPPPLLSPQPTKGVWDSVPFGQTQQIYSFGPGPLIKTVRQNHHCVCLSMWINNIRIESLINKCLYNIQYEVNKIRFCVHFIFLTA